MIDVLDSQCDARTRSHAIEELLLNCHYAEGASEQENLLPTFDSVRKALETARGGRTQVETVPKALRVTQEEDISPLLSSRHQLDVLELERCARVVHELTSRQRDILRAFAQGRTPQEVADMLCITMSTVNTHLTKIYEVCRSVWDISYEHVVNYHFLHIHFGRYFSDEL